MFHSKRPRQSSVFSAKPKDKDRQSRIDKQFSITTARSAAKWNPEMMDEIQMLNLLLEIPRRDYLVISKGKPPSAFIIEDCDVIAAMGKGCDLFNFLMYELITFLLTSNGFFHMTTPRSAMSFPHSKANEETDMMKALEDCVVKRFRVSSIEIFDIWKTLKGTNWNRMVKDTKRNLYDHWASIALKPSCEYTQLAVVGFTASTDDGDGSFLDSTHQSFRNLPHFWVGHESSVDDESSPAQPILWKPLDPTSWTQCPGPLTVLLDRLRELQNIDEHISTITAKYAKICEKYNLRTFDMISFLNDDSRFNESYNGAVKFFNLQLETLRKVGFVESCAH
jgi:hypothetical protein